MKKIFLTIFAALLFVSFGYSMQKVVLCFRECNEHEEKRKEFDFEGKNIGCSLKRNNGKTYLFGSTKQSINGLTSILCVKMGLEAQESNCLKYCYREEKKGIKEIVDFDMQEKRFLCSGLLVWYGSKISKLNDRFKKYCKRRDEFYKRETYTEDFERVLAECASELGKGGRKVFLEEHKEMKQSLSKKLEQERLWLEKEQAVMEKLEYGIIDRDFLKSYIKRILSGETF